MNRSGQRRWYAAALSWAASRSPTLRLVHLGLDVHRTLTTAYFVTVVAGGLLSPAFTVATGAVVAAVTRGDGAWLAFAIASGLYLVHRLLVPVQQELGAALARRVDEVLAERMMITVSGPPGLGHVEDPATLDAIEKAQGSLVHVTPGGAVLRLGAVWAPRLRAAVSLAIVGLWRWWAVIVLGLVHALAFVSARWHWHQVTEIVYGRSTVLRRAQYLRKLALAPTYAKELRVFGLATWLVDRYRGAWFGVMRDAWRRRRDGWLAALAIYGLACAAEGAIVLAVVADATSGELTLERAVIVAGSVVAAGALAVFEDSHWYVGEAAAALAQLEAVRLAVPRVAGVASGTASAADLPRHTICFESVRFGYPGRDAPVFTAFDLEIEVGRSLAIVGTNGAGKTTLVKLLARLHDPDAGRITVDGIDLRDLAPRSWQRRIAAVFQDFTQFELTAEDNVAFGALHRRGDRAAVQRAANLAGAAATVAGLSRGWETPLGRQVSGGTQLSGGQWQRLALARALFAVQAGARVLVLDEPTAAFDVRGETELCDRFLELTRGLTTIVISHRFSTVRRADRIVVLEDGHVVEDGEHSELMAAGGRYAAMYTLQASRFEAPGDTDA